MQFSKPSILAVDDDPSILSAIVELLKVLDCRVVAVGSGEEALKHLEDREHAFAVVLLDVNMPGLDGFETALRIKQHEPPLHLPVIFLSGQPTTENICRGYQEGAVDFLSKPFSPVVLRSKVRVFLELFHTRQTLAKREQFISAIAEAVPELIYVYDLAEGRNIFLNQEVTSLLGYTPEQALARGSTSIEALVHPDDLDDYRTAMNRIADATDGEVQRHVFRMRHANGNWRWIASQRKPFSRDPDGTLRTFVGAAHDVTDQHVAEEEVRRLNTELEGRVEERSRALGEAEERFRLLMENVTDHAIFTIDPSGRILEWNTGAERIFDYRTEEVVGQSFSILFTPEDREKGIPEQEMQNAATIGRATDERWHLRKNGQQFFASGVSTALRDEAGSLRGFAKICRDQTLQKMAQDTIIESEQRLQLLTDSLPALIAYVGPDLRYHFNNIMYEEWFGLRREELTGRTMREVLGEQAMKVLLPYVQQVLQGHRVHFRAVVSYPNGTREVEGDYVPHVNKEGEVEGFAILKADITQRAAEERRRQFLLEVSTALASTLDFESTLTRVISLAVPSLADWCAVDLLDEENRGIRRLAVAHPDPEKELLVLELEKRYPAPADSDTGTASVIRSGQSLLVSVVTDEMLQAVAQDAEHLALLRRLNICSYLCVPLLARGRAIGALTFASADGTRIRYGPEDQFFAEELARYTAASIDNALLFRAVQEENAQRREAEVRLANAHEEVIRASQAKSTFLSSMSHELRTPLNAIIGYAELLQEEMEDEGDRRRSGDLAKIQSSARHLLALINDVLDLSKIEAGKVALVWEDADIEAVVEEAISMVLPLAERNGNRVEVACAGRMGSVRTDATRLRQILFNLLSNAAKFTHHGTIKVECRRSQDDQGRHWVELWVEDTGAGIPAGEIGQLFQKFQQLEAGRKFGGTGLGLAITRLLARALGGDVLVQSEVELGSTFTVRLPIDGETGQ